MMWLDVRAARSIQVSLMKFSDSLMLIDADLPTHLAMYGHLQQITARECDQLATRS